MKTPLLLRTDGTTELLAYMPPQDEMGKQELRDSLATLQAAVGGYIEAVTVPEDESLILLVNEDGLILTLPFNSLASAVARRAIVGDAVLMPKALLR